MSTRAIIALGSNLGDRLTHLQKARAALKAIVVPGTWRQSGIYQTEPVHCPDESPDFYNAIVSFEFTGTAAELHDHTRAIEQAMGRERSSTNAPRTIDLDLLLFGEQIINTPDLQIPHPRLHLRRFVLEPLTEIHPHQMHPAIGKTITDCLAGIHSSEPPLQLLTSQW
jgi:2-amino-4-hydroxy-6-hydroxymethyldihydropteridine diphosphokinase